MKTMQFFDELPKGRTTRDEPVDWAQAKADLMANPGQWGLIAKNISGTTPGQIRKGKYKDFAADELEHFEFVTRRPEEPDESYTSRRTDLYGRYSVDA